MRRFRLALRAIAVTWLLAQVIAMAAAPIVLANHAEEVDADCTCTHGPNAICPMHHKPASGASVCVIGGIDNSLGVLASVFHAIGLVPAPAQIASVTFIPVRSTSSATTTSPRTVPPDPPPPRA